MILEKCTFDQLPGEMKMHVMYIEKIPVSEFKLVIWNIKNTLYYNNLKESEVKRFVALIESEKRYLNNRTLDSIYNKYGFAVYREIHEAHEFLVKQELARIAECTAAEYMPIIEKYMDRPSIPVSQPLLKAMSHAATKGNYRFSEWSTEDTYIYFMGYLLGSGKLKWDRRLGSFH